MFGENEDGKQTQDTHDRQILKSKTKNESNGRDGAPALMHRPAATEAAPSPEKKRGVFPHG